LKFENYFTIATAVTLTLRAKVKRKCWYSEQKNWKRCKQRFSKKRLLHIFKQTTRQHHVLAMFKRGQ